MLRERLFLARRGRYNSGVPKRSRQAHIPSQIHKRKPRRGFGLAGAGAEVGGSIDPSFADPPSFMTNGGATAAIGGSSGPVDTRPRTGRRYEAMSRTRDQVNVRVIPGQLPVFERSYLMTELRRIFMISGSLLAVIIILAFILR